MMPTFADAVDDFIELFSPKRALNRKVARHALRQYAAAKTTPTTGAWNPVDAGVNDEIGGSKASINNRVRQLSRDMPHFAAAIARLEDYVVGTGINPQPMVLMPGSDEDLNTTLNAQLEEGWKRFSDDAHSGRQLHMTDLMRTAKRQDTEIGEFFMVRRIDRRRDTYLPITYTQYEGDVISDLSGHLAPAVAGENAFKYGIEYNANTMEVKAYHIQNDTDGRLIANTTRVRASQAMHGFQTLRPNQLRGITPFAPGILMAHSLRGYLEAEMDAAQIAARIYAWVTTPDPAATQTAMGSSYDSTFERQIEEVGTAVREYLLPTEQVTVNTQSRPGDAFTPYTRFVLRAFSIVTGIAYPILTNDYDSISYSNHRGMRNDMMKTIQPMMARHVRQFCKPIYHDFLDWMALTNRVQMPGYFADPWQYRRVAWLGPGVESIDPLREGKADVEAVNNLLKSPLEVIRSRGRDPEEVLNETAQFKQMAEDRGLDIVPTSLGMQTNPAKQGAAEVDEGNDDDRSLIVLRS